MNSIGLIVYFYLYSLLNDFPFKDKFDLILTLKVDQNYRNN